MRTRPVSREGLPVRPFGSTSIALDLGPLARGIAAAALAFGLAAAGRAVAADRNAPAAPAFRVHTLSIARPAANRLAGFTTLPPGQTGLHFTNRISDDRSIANRNLLSGSGVAAGDIDGDGLADLYFCGLDSDNRLFRNRGQWQFEDITERAGVACPGQDSTGATLADLDGDRDLDLLVNALGRGTRLFFNDGSGRFTERTEEAKVASNHGSMSMALADIDGDGDLDLYVCNFFPTTIKDQPRTRFSITPVEGRPVVTAVNGRAATLPDLTNRFVVTPSGDVLEQGQADDFFINDGKGRFTRRSFTDGSFLNEEGQPLATTPRDWGLAARFHDVNGDGAPDLYVCNDLWTPDRFWINDGRGGFRAIARLAVRNLSSFSMGVDFGDLNRDGNVDFFVVDMLSRDPLKRFVQVSSMESVVWPVGIFDNRPQFPRNTLHVHRGDLTFAEIAAFAGIDASEWSWGPIFLDVDLDGYEDILVTNGQWRDFQNADAAARIDAARTSRQLTATDIAQLQKSIPRLETPNLAFRNRGDLTFAEVGGVWGFDLSGVSQGMCLADLDQDGDLDLAINNLNAPATLLRNDATQPRVAVRLRGQGPNSQGIGARVRLLGGAVPQQSQEFISGGRYLSGDEPMRVFAAGAAGSQLSLEVHWRNGQVNRLNAVQPNALYEIDEPAAPPRTQLESPHIPTNHVPGSTWFTDVSAQLASTHQDEAFNDFALQPLLPRRLSQLGPGVGWLDLDGDDREELVVGSGRSGPVSAFRSTTNGVFQRLDGAIWQRPLARDTTGLAGLDEKLILGSSSYEDGRTQGGILRIYDARRGASGESVSGREICAGPIAVTDVDGDGDLDVFVGNRVRRGSYPAGGASLLLRNERGRLVVAEEWNLGLVSGAVWTDLDNDGRDELVLACEWGPIRILAQVEGKFVERTAAWQGLEALLGRWHGVTAGDLDNDGRMDLVASNWGKNSPSHIRPGQPNRLRFGDLDNNGTFEVIESHWDESLGRDIPLLGWQYYRHAIPALTERIASYQQFASLPLPEVIGEPWGALLELRANGLSSLLLLNRGDHFDARELPAEAQWAAGFGVSIADFNGDGNEDVFLAQNFFGLHPAHPRMDAGRGVLMTGDGRGSLTPVPGHISGIHVYGEGRGSAVGDYDEDGRVDLLVGQNGAETKLFHNRTARPGVRVRLRGREGNRLGIGAVLRMRTGNAWGPARQVKSGSGYWSNDAATQIVTGLDGPAEIEVRWLGGQVTRGHMPPGARTIEVLQRENRVVAP